MLQPVPRYILINQFFQTKHDSNLLYLIAKRDNALKKSQNKTKSNEQIINKIVGIHRIRGSSSFLLYSRKFYHGDYTRTSVHSYKYRQYCANEVKRICLNVPVYVPTCRIIHFALTIHRHVIIGKTTRRSCIKIAQLSYIYLLFFFFF